MVCLFAQALGAMLAAHKLWPVLRWQMAFPREAAPAESNALSSLLSGTVNFLSGASQSLGAPWRFYYEWEQFSFVGPLPWVLGLAAIAAAVLQPWKTLRASRDAVTLLYALLLVAIGLALAVGNASTNLGGVFASLPLLSGIRGFGRYQILVVFGLSILTGMGVVALSSSWRGHRHWRVAEALLAITTMVPVLAQTGVLVWHVSATPNSELLARYQSPDRPDIPELVTVRPVRDWEARDQSSLILGGFWIANCYSNLWLPVLPELARPGLRLPISNPPPERIRYLRTNEMALEYPAGRPVALNLRLLGGFELNVPSFRRGNRVHVRGDDQVDGLIMIRAIYPGTREGVVLSSAALVLTLGLFFRWLATRRARAAQ
jgi:hypothetical protein